jgi:succinate dehydrogenase / fumarate reductase cytochrome b subunit
MKHTKVIVVGEVIMFGGFLLHIVQGIMLMRKNASARTQGYAVAHKHEKVKWTSKYMGPFGIVILLFLGLHLYDFFSFKYFRYLDGSIDATNITYLKDTAAKVIYDGVKMDNLHAKVHEVYVASPFHWIIYALAMFVIALHLNHGFQSAFQSLGINHKKYTPFIKALGTGYSIIIPLLFALIPLLIKFNIVF